MFIERQDIGKPILLTSTENEKQKKRKETDLHRLDNSSSRFCYKHLIFLRLISFFTYENKKKQNEI